MTLLISIFCALALAGGLVAAPITNYWIGAASGGTWSTTANWEAKTPAGASTTVTWDTTNLRAVDLTKLENGATMYVDIKDLQFGVVVFKKRAEGDTWTIDTSGSGYFNKLSASQFIIPTGCTLNWLAQFNQAYDKLRTMTISGGGTLYMGVTKSFVPYEMTMVISDSRLIVPSTTKMGQVIIQLDGDNAYARIEKDDFYIRGLKSTRGTPNFDMNGYSVVISTGYHALGACTYGGNIIGATNLARRLYIREGTFQTFTKATVNNYLHMNSGYLDLPKTAQFNASVIETAQSGRLASSNSIAVAKLMGAGIKGGVDMGAGTTLSVTGTVSAASFEFAGAIAGDTKLVVDATNAVMTMTGQNRHTGGTEVKNGQLVISSTATATRQSAGVPPSDSAIYLDFENASNLAENKGNSVGLHSAYNSSYVYQSDGVIGSGFYMNGSGNLVVATSADNSILPIGYSSFTVSIWVRPRVDPFTSDYPVIYTRGAWWQKNGGLDWFFYGNQNHDPNKLQIGFRKMAYGEDAKVLDSRDKEIYYPRPSGKTWYDLGWQHFAVTYTNHCLKLYRNGELVNENSSMPDPNTFGTGGISLGGGTFIGWMDEFVYSGRAWTADEVKTEYQRVFRQGKLGECVNAADALPTPVAHYEFEDATQPGKDSSPNHYDLVTPAEVYVPEDQAGKSNPKTYTISRNVEIKDNVPGSIGKCGYFYLTALEAESFPSLIPTGNSSFTMSVRFQRWQDLMGPSMISWGAYEPNNTFVRMMFGSSPSYVRVGMCHNSDGSGGSHGGDNALTIGSYLPVVRGDPRSWVHVVYTYDAETQTHAGYYDGVMVASGKKSEPYNLAATDFRLGFAPQSKSWSGSGEKFYSGYLDDVRVYDVALTEAQVKTLVTSLATGKVEPTLPEGSAITVAAPATLKVAAGADHAFSSLACDGTLNLLGSTRVTVSNDSTIAKVTGSGALRADGATVTVSDANYFSGILEATNGLVSVKGPSFGSVRLMAGGRVRTTGTAFTLPIPIDEEFTIYANADGSNLPVVQTPGAVTVPSVAYLTFDSAGEVSQKRIRKYNLVTGVFDAPNLSGWKYSGADGNFDVGFRYQDNDDGTRTIYAHLHFGGTIFVVR